MLCKFGSLQDPATNEVGSRGLSRPFGFAVLDRSRNVLATFKIEITIILLFYYIIWWRSLILHIQGWHKTL